MSDPETEWMKVSFDFKFIRTNASLENIDRVALLTGLGKAIAYLLLPEEDYDTAKIFVKNLDLHPTQFLTDAMIDDALQRFTREEGEEP